MTTPVNCTGNPSDRALIQAAIDAAGTNDTLLLNGTCQLDGKKIYIDKSNLTITGVGAAGGWSSVIKGLADANGLPQLDKDTPTRTLWNRALFVGDKNNSGNAVISNVTISNIKFSTLNRSIAVQASFGQTSQYCRDHFAGAGSASNIVIQDNWFDNDVRAGQVYGRAQDIKMRNNIATNGFDQEGNFYLGVSGRVACYSDAEDNVAFNGDIGTPKNISLTGNNLTTVNSCSSINTQSADSVEISNNTLKGSGFVASVWINNGVVNSRVVSNYVDGTSPAGVIPWGIFASDDIGVPSASNNNTISNNTIVNEEAGIVIDANTQGYSIINNRVANSSFVDIFLCDNGNLYYCAPGGNVPSYNNKVVTTNFSNKVFDGGRNNKLLGTSKLLNSRKVPSAVKAAKIKAALGRPLP